MSELVPSIPDYNLTSLPQVAAACRGVYLRRREIIGVLGVEQARELLDRVSAVEAYVRRKAEKSEARRAARILEAALGAALGEAEHGGDRRSDQVPRVGLEAGLSPQDRHRFRRMFEHLEIWEPRLEGGGLTRAEVLRLIDSETNGERPPVETATAADLDALIGTGRRFGTIYADPPWLYSNQGTRAATSNHYEGMSVDELCSLPVGELAADDAHLHLWITNGFLFEAPKIFAAWGFEFRSTFVWVKPQMGIGNYWRNSHELLLTAIRGNAKRFAERNLTSWGEFARRRHSAKPEAVRRFLERASPAPRLELFGRAAAEGWTVWGNEVSRSLFVEAEVIE